MHLHIIMPTKVEGCPEVVLNQTLIAALKGYLVYFGEHIYLFKLMLCVQKVYINPLDCKTDSEIGNLKFAQSP